MTPCPGNPPVMLDFDGSIMPLTDGELRIPLDAWQEKIRFGCTRGDYAALEEFLRSRLPEGYGPVFMGSGDYHHVSLFLLRELCEKRALGAGSLDVVVLDNHPDNMRYPFGIHCGSWVRHACAITCVRHVHVVGICSDDITLKHAWENCLTPFLRRKLTYWSIGKKAGWLRLIGRGGSSRSFGSANELIEELLPVLEAAGQIYLSLDKDVFGGDMLETDWDQGIFEFEHLSEVLGACAGKLLGCDICGELAGTYAYKSRIKRFLSRLDGQGKNDPAVLKRLQGAQRIFNINFLNLLAAKRRT